MNYRILHFHEIDSTHLYARRHLHDFQNNTIITAESQTNAIGQYGKKWTHYSKKCFAGSFIFINTPLNQQHIGHISFVVSVAISLYFEDNHFSCFTLKWPNDFYNKEHTKKFAGILCEYANERLIISLGVNQYAFNHAELKHTSLENMKAVYLLQHWNNVSLFQKIEEAIFQYQTIGFQFFKKEWLKRCGHIQKKLTTSQNISGIFRTIDDFGNPVFF